MQDGKKKPSAARSRVRKPAGGSATGGGMNFQAVVTTIAGVHLLRGTPLNWLEGTAIDTPVAISAETAGPGDDVRVELQDGSLVEVQAKKGLTRGESLWNALIALARGVTDGKVTWGVLAAAPDSSASIREDLSSDMRRIGEG